MDRTTLIFACLFLPLLAFGQLQDDFSDGNFDASPSWQGDIADFIVNSTQELQLDAASAGSSVLHTAVNFPDSAVWEFYIRMAFAPSSSNRLRVYLQTDQVPMNTGNAYFIEIGEQGSDDAIRFFRQDAGTATEIGQASSGAVGSDPVNIRLQINRNSQSEWIFSIDYNGGNNLQEDLRVTDDTYLGTNGFFGFECFYTSSRTNRFFFDDISVEALVSDTTPPVLTEVDATSSQSISVLFDETVDPSSATIPANYTIDQGIGNPLSATLDIDNPRLVQLQLATSMVNQQNYQLTSNNIADLEGNVSGQQQLSFLFLNIQEAAPNDLIITEIMADPAPAIGLPETEFIEIFNRSNKVIQLEDFILADPSKEVILPEQLILPGAYLILYEIGTADFSALGPSLPLQDFPGLGNTRDRITLLSPDGLIINQVEYSIEWYQSSTKVNGGYTLELIAPDRPCTLASNWIGSDDPKGGTPGQVNSVFSSDLDLEGPALVRATIESEQNIGLQFAEVLDEMSALTTENFVLEGIAISSTTFDPSTPQLLTLNLAAPLQAGIIYNLDIQTTLTDCQGNENLQSIRTQVALADRPTASDVVINELLFDPLTGGRRFVEFFNRSDKIIDMADLIIADRDELGSIDNISPIRVSFLLFPGEYVAVTESPIDIQNKYSVLKPEALLESDLPSYDSREGTVVLYTIDGNDTEIIDEFAYDRSFHSPFLDDREGVSLERIDAEAITQSAANWQSAAEQAGFATPTARNSQSTEFVQPAGETLSIPRAVLSPDGDSRDDFLAILYNADQSGSVANIKIFDSEGRLIRDLVQNQLLGQEGSFKWEGETDEGTKARIGIYIVWAEIFKPDGSVESFKKTVVLAEQL
ncbi:MAG: lamin tail domain-containing protein [Bacteroidota bacterium]